MTQPTSTHQSDPHGSILGSRQGAPGQPPTMGGESERADVDVPSTRPTTIRGVYDAYGGYIASIVRRLLGARRRADVSDVVNLSLIEINKGLPRFEPSRGTSLRVWMYPIVVRTARRYARKGRSLASLMVHLDDEELEGTVRTDDVMTAADLMSGDELRHLWDELTARLPAKQRVLLRMHVLSGLTSAEIAVLKGWNKNTTRGDLTDAKRALETLHRQWQAQQERAGATAMPLAFAFWSAHVQETAQYIPESMRAELLATVEKLEAVGPGAALDHARPVGRRRLKARALRPVLASTTSNVGGGLAGALILAVTMVIMVVLALAAQALRARPASVGTTTSTAASALVATASPALAAAPVAAPVPAPSPASPPPRAPAATVPAPGSAHVGAALAAQDAHRAAIVQTFTRALNEHRHNEACAALADYDAHRFGDAGAADRARMARLVGTCDRK